MLLYKSNKLFIVTLTIFGIFVGVINSVSLVDLCSGYWSVGISLLKAVTGIFFFFGPCTLHCMELC